MKVLFYIFCFSLLISAAHSQDKDADYYIGKGLEKYYKNDFVGAIEDYSRAIKIDTNSSVAFYDRGLAKYMLKDYSAAIEDFDRTIILNPKYTAAYNNRGNCKLYLEDYSSAIADYDVAILLDVNYSDPYYNRGLAKMYLKSYRNAIDDFTKAIELDSNYSNAFYYRAVVKNTIKEYSAAIPDLDKTIKLVDNKPAVYNERGIARYNLNDFQAAIADYNKAIELDKNYTTAYYNRCLVKYKLKNYQAAIDDCTSIIESGIDSLADIYAFRADFKKLDNDTLGAIDDYKAAIELNKYDLDNYISLGVLLVKKNRNEEAKEVFNEGLKIEPKNYLLANNFAWILFDAENYTLAIEMFLKTLTYGDYQFTDVYLGLSASYFKISDLSNSHKYYDKAKEIKEYLSKGAEAIEELEADGYWYTANQKKILGELLNQMKK